MKKTSLFLALILVCRFLLPGQNPLQDNRGQSASPVYSERRDLYILYEQGGAVHIGHISPAEGEPIFYSRFLVHQPARHPDLKKGSGGDIWAVWEGINGNGSDIFLSSLESGSCGNPVKINEGFAGTNSSPSLAVDKNGFPWIAWINHSQGIDRVFVYRQETGQAWQANSSLSSSVFSPQISVDDTLDVWVFWVSQHRGPGEIYGRRLSGTNWSDEFALNSDCRFPHLDPEVNLDWTGRPWVVWSAYDGEDYEIFYSRWLGTKWAPEMSLTNNRGHSDLSPSLSFLPGNTAILAWSQASKGSRICVKQLRNGKWGETRFLSPIDTFNRRPKIAQSPDQIAIAWENTSTGEALIQMSAASFPSLEYFSTPTADLSLQTPQPIPWRKFLSPFLSSIPVATRFSAFGDSITYGVLNRTWFPDKGYVPRLDILVKDLSAAFHVINRGIPGEKTAEGLARIEEEITTYKAKYIFLMEGTNDMSGGVPSQVAAFNMEEMIEKCFQNGVYPLLGTVIPRADSFWEGSIRQNTLLLNDLLRDLASGKKISLTDHYETFMAHPTGYLDLFSDGAHPNEAGYQKIAESWFQSLDRIPWPPVNLTVERKTDKVLFYGQAVNVLNWEENPLLSPQTQIERHVIYRKTNDESGSHFVVLAVVSGDSLFYLDREISADIAYSYFIRAEDGSGLEGPASSTVRDR
jgi:lysophospholipase L1-like esterase